MTNYPAQPNLEALLAHSGWVRSLAGSLVADSFSADDVEQEVWLQAMQSPPKHGGNLRGWLARVVRNVAAQRGRQEGRSAARHERLNRESDSETGAGPHQSPPSTPEELAERSETFQALARATGELAEPFASAIYLRYVEELSVAEVARRQEVGVPTATSRIKRGLELLRAQLQGRFGDTWRARCLVFTPSLSKAPVSQGTTGVIAMSLKAKLLVAAALSLPLIPLFSEVDSEALTPDALEQSEVATRSEPEVIAPPVAQAQVVTPRVEVATSVGADEQAPASVTQEDELRALQVVVRDAATLKPVAGAEVLYFDRASPQDKAWGKDQFTRFDDVETLLERYGKRFVSDGEGHVRLPARKSYAHIGARLNGTFAATYLFEDPGTDGGTEVELLLRPTQEILVRVIDPLGKLVPDQRVEYQDAFGNDFAQCLRPSITDEQGIAHFKNIQERLAGGSEQATHRIALPVPGGVVVHEFPLHEPPTEMITLQLPATGDVRVLLRDALGNPGRDGKFVNLQAFDARDAENSFKRANAQRGALSARSKDGEVLFKNIALDTELAAWIEFPGRPEAVEVIAQGPARAGEERTLTLIVPPVPSIVNLMILDDEGRPVASGALDLRQVVLMPGRELDSVGLRVGSNAEGRTRFYQQRLADEQDPQAARAIMRTVVMQAEEGFARWGVTSWPAVIPAGEVEVGELVLGPERIASGVVYGEDDEPLPFAEFNLRIPAPWPNSEAEQIWVSFKADQNGRFRVMGEGLADGVELEVDVSEPSTDQSGVFRGNQFALVVGKADQALRMNTERRVKGRVLLPAGVPHDKVRLQLELMNARGDLSYHYLELDRTNGRFSRGQLPAGLAHLVLSGSAGVELIRSEPFRTDEGGLLTPRGWEVLDLTGSVFVHRLQVSGADGERPARLEVRLDEFDKVAVEPNPAVLVSAQDSLQISVQSKGYRVSESLLLSGELEVELKAGIPVRVELAQGLKLPEGSWRLYLLEPEREGLTGRLTHQLELATDGNSWSGRIPAPGTYALGLARAVNVPGAPNAAGLRPVLGPNGAPTRDVQLFDQESTQTILLHINQRALDTAAER